MTAEHVDVLIVGAGISGISAAYYLQKRCPIKTFVLLEARNGIGGTWDLFRYPGVRSDSDMYTLGYSFRPWRGSKAIVDGKSILNYIRETSQEYGIDHKIRFGVRVKRAEWSSKDALWTVEAERDGETLCFTCNFLYMCSGYYDYDSGYTPEWHGVEHFTGQIIHPQKWPENLDYTGKRVIVIGSGATAVTLVPAMAEKAAHVTMLQRSATYIIPRPSQDKIVNWMQRYLPARVAYGFARWKAILLSIYFYSVSRRRPADAKKVLLDMIRQELGADYDIEKHFTPTYNPWDQRVCLVPDADLFKAIKTGKVSVVTDHIDTFTENGICLRSGEELTADIIVTATGLVMKIMNGIPLVVDGKPVQLSNTLSYKGMMFSDIPNLAASFGYTNASWTLKCELISQYVCRLLKYMDAHGYNQCTPRRNDPNVTEEPVIDFTSGYVQRAIDTLPRQGSKVPWKLYQNYILDLMTLKYGRLEDGTMEFK